MNDSMIRIFSGLSTRFNCNDAFESQINVGPKMIATFLASIYRRDEDERERPRMGTDLVQMTFRRDTSKMRTEIFESLESMIVQLNDESFQFDQTLSMRFDSTGFDTQTAHFYRRRDPSIEETSSSSSLTR